MSIFTPGLVHTPVTPFTRDLRIDFALFEKILEFHLRHGAEALALPMHAGESVSLSDEEQRRLLDFALGQVKGRVPVIAHVSDAGTAIVYTIFTICLHNLQSTFLLINTTQHLIFDFYFFRRPIRSRCGSFSEC